FIAVATDNIEVSLGQARPFAGYCQEAQRDGAKLRGFDDHRVAAGERRSDVATGELERKIPGDDDSDHADGDKLRVVEKSLAERYLPAVKLPRESCVVLEVARRILDFIPRKTDALPILR